MNSLVVIEDIVNRHLSLFLVTKGAKRRKKRWDKFELIPPKYVLIFYK